MLVAIEQHFQFHFLSLLDRSLHLLFCKGLTFDFLSLLWLAQREAQRTNSSSLANASSFRHSSIRLATLEMSNSWESERTLR